MRPAVLEHWSSGTTGIHRRDPRAKLIALLVLLIALATAGRGVLLLGSGLLLVLTFGLQWGRIPVTGGLARAALVLPFTAVFAAIAFLAGDAEKGAVLATKSYISALAVVLTVSTTPLPLLLRGCGQLGAPRFFLEVGQFLYRYLFVIAMEAQHMAHAAQARGGSLRRWRGYGRRFRAAAGALAVLFAHSSVRAGEIHCAMLSRGFEGTLPLLEPSRFRRSDALFLVAALILILVLRIAAEGLSKGTLA